MKKLFAIIVMFMISMAVMSQTQREIGEVFSKLLIEHLEGSIELERNLQEKMVQTYIVDLPDYYDDDFVLGKVYSFVSSFNDVSFLKVWKKNVDGEYECSIVISPKDYSVAAMLFYAPGSNKIVIGYYYGTSANIVNQEKSML
jgi:hypothetical protein